MHENSLSAYRQLDRSRSRHKIIETMVKIGETTRQGISSYSHIPINSVCGRVKELLDDGWIVETGEQRYVNGRPRSVLALSNKFRELSE